MCDRYYSIFFSFNVEVTVGFEQASYKVTEDDGYVNVTLETSGLGGGVLECDVDVMLLFSDGPKASKLIVALYSIGLSCPNSGG